MELQKKILAICGSTRKNSVNLQILQALPNIYPSNMVWETYTGLADLPHFNADISEDAIGSSVAAFRQLVANADGIIICTPEYVFSLPGSLKNALEWLVSGIAMTHKPTALITASTAGVKAHEQLALIMQTLGCKTSTDACLLIQAPKTKINAEGEIINPETKRDLKNLCKELEILMHQ
jgi:NAD(P)H-dependent FMN reductase